MARLEIRLFGEVEVYLDGQLVRFPTHKTKELFAYLVLHHRHAHSRVTLAGLLWPESDEERAKANLRQTLSRLRHVLEGAECLQFSGGAVQFRSNDFWCDVLEFERLVRESTDLERALELYRGPFLCDLYEDWVLIEQERLQTLYLKALELLAELYQSSGAFEKALNTWKKTLQVMPWHERAHRELMTLYAQRGDRTAALKQYREYAKTVEKELNAAPLPEMRALYDQLAQGIFPTLDRAVPVALPSEIPFVGRARELQKLRALWQEVQQGHGQVVLVVGEVGVGKTTLVRHFLEEIRRVSSRVGVFQTAAYKNALPYQMLWQAVRSSIEEISTDTLRKLPAPWRSELARFIPELQERLSEKPVLPPAQGKALWYDALTGFFELLAQERPLVLFFDDLHWADGPTLEYLSHWIVHLKSLRILLIGTYRAEERASVQSWLDALGPAQGYQPLTLARLSREETAQLSERWLGRLSPQTLALLYSKTEGNPLFAKELIRSLVSSGTLTKDDTGLWNLTVSQLSAAHLPESLRELVYASVRRAPQRAHRLLGLIAVRKRACELPVLEEVLGQPEEKIINELDELRRLGLLVETDKGYHCSHELIWQVLYDELSADRKKLWHRQIAQALEKLYPHELDRLAGELAEHCERSQLWEKAILYAMRAGEQAQKLYAYGDAQRYFAKALKLFEQFRSPLSPQQQHLKLEVLSSYADESVFPTVSDVAAALEELQAAVSQMIALAEQLGDRGKLCKAYQQRARLELAAGSRDAAHTNLQRALSLSHDLAATSELALVLERTGRLYRQMGEYSWALEGHRQAEQVGIALGDLGVQGKALADIAVIEMFVGKFADARTHMEKALELLQRAGRRRVQASALNNLGIILQEQGDYHRARTFYEQAYQLMSAAGDARGIGIVLLNLGRLANDQGNYEMALEYLERVVAKLAQPGLAGLEIETFSEKGRAHLGLGELKLAMECSSRAVCLLEADRGIAMEAQRFYFTHYQILQASGRSDAATGYLLKAHDEVCRIARDIQEEAWKKSFLENVPLNRQIIEEWQATLLQDAHGKTVKG